MAWIRISQLIILLCTLTSCMSDQHLAPVTDGWQQSKNTQGAYQVGKGDTLYSIAWRYGLDYRDLAATNHISAPYAIHTGQQLSLSTPTIKQVDQPVAKTSPVKLVRAQPAVATVPQNTVSQDNPVKPVKAAVVSARAPEPVIEEPRLVSNVKGWVWPANGKVVAGYQDNGGMNKGLDIAGSMGAPVRAAAGGRIVYCGSGLRGYGNLIIIKHDSEFLSAYAHNQKLLVHEGQAVKTGEVIATIGDSDAKRPVLHFEIRRAGKPIDPLGILPQRT